MSAPDIDHPHGRELEAINGILRNHPGMVRFVLQDLTRGVTTDEGREGMTAEQVLWVAIIKQLNGSSYDELSFHLPDSRTYRGFCGSPRAAHRCPARHRSRHSCRFHVRALRCLQPLKGGCFSYPSQGAVAEFDPYPRSLFRVGRRPKQGRLDRTTHPNGKERAMPRVVITHAVADVERWLKGSQRRSHHDRSG